MPRYRDLLPGLRAYVRDCWIASAPTTINGAARALGELRPAAGGKGVAASTPAITLFDWCEAEGVVVRDPERSTRKRRVLVAWNWSGLPLSGQTLRTALEGWLAAPEAPSRGVGQPVDTVLPDGRRRRLAPVASRDRQRGREALRLVLGARLGDPCASRRTDDALLSAAARVPAEELRHLPREAAKLGGANGDELSRALRNLLRYAADHDLVALHVPPPQRETPWAEWLDEHVVQHSARSWLHRLRATLEMLYGGAAPATPGDVTVQQANEALAHLEREPKGERAVREVRSALISLGLRGLGPYAQLRELNPVTRVSGRHFGPHWCLGPKGGAQVTLTWQGTRALLEAHGLPPKWLDWWDWFGRYSTMDRTRYRLEFGGSAPRREIRRLSAKTSRQRHMALRHYVGAALTLEGLEPGACTPARVFSMPFIETITFRIKAAWEERVRLQEKARSLDLPVVSQRVSDDSPSLSRHLVNAGLIAESLALWAEYQERIGQPVATPEEIDAWRRAYEWANEEVKAEGGSLRSAKRTRKDLGAILTDRAGLALLPRALSGLRRRVENAGGERDTAIAAQRYLIAVLGAMGMDRIGEAARFTFRHLREQTAQAIGAQRIRYFVLEANERKNRVEHQIPLLQELVPQWLWAYWTETGRPILMRRWFAADPGRRDHDYVLVSPESGAPFGGVADTSDPSTAAENVARREMNAASALGEQYRSWRIAALRTQGYAVMRGGFGHHGPHAERARVRRLIQAVNLPEDRATVLLGHKGNTTAARNYGMSLAELNADTLRQILAAKPWLGTGEVRTDDESVAAGRRRQRREREQLERDARVGHWVRENLLNGLDELAPKEALDRLYTVRRQLGLEIGGPKSDAA